MLNRPVIKIKIFKTLLEPPIVMLKEFSRDKTLADYLAGLCLDERSVIVSGKANKDLSYHPQSHEEIFVVDEVRAPAIPAIITFFSAAWAFAVAHPFLVLGAIYSVYSYLTRPRMPSFNIGSGLDQSSPTYSWEGGRTIQEVGTPVPIVYGVHKVWGNIVNQYQTTDGDKNYLHLLLLLCEGPVESIEDIKINDIPIGNYNDVTYETRLGTNDQEPLSGFGDLHHLNDMNIQLIKNSEFIYTTIRDDVEAFELYFSFPQGLFEQDGSGNIKSWSISYRVKYKAHSSGVWIDDGIQTITAANRSIFKRIFQKTGLSPNQYDISITKTSEEPSATQIGAIHLTAVDEITLEDIAYRNRAMLAIHALANNQLSGASRLDVSCVINGAKVAVPQKLREEVVLDLEFENNLADSSDMNHTVTKVIDDSMDNMSFTSESSEVIYGGYSLLSEAVAVANAYPYLDVTQINGLSTDEFAFTNPGATLEITMRLLKFPPMNSPENNNIYLFHRGGGGNDSFLWNINFPTNQIGGDDYGDEVSANLSLTCENSIGQSLQIYSNNFTMRIGHKTHIAINYDSFYFRMFVDQVEVMSATQNNKNPGTLTKNPKLIRRSQNWVTNRGLEFTVDRILFTKKYLTPEEFDLTPDIQHSANPIWAIRDLLTNSRYGLGEYMTDEDIDLDHYQEMADYCDELVDDGNGGQEERHRLDVVIDSRVRARELISQLATSFRGLPFNSMGKFYLRIDKPVASSSQPFTMGNIIKDSFSQKWKSDKERYNIVQVQFLDRDKDYAQENVLVIDEDSLAAGDEQRVMQLRLFVTRMSEAIREGRYALKVSKYINRVIKFRTPMNAITAQPGDRIDMSHDVPQIGFSGKVISDIDSGVSVVYLDRDVTIPATGTYKLKVFFADHTFEEVTVTNAAGTTNRITVYPAFSQVPAAFDDYVFGEVDILVEPLRIIDLERDSNDTVSVTAVEYIEDVYNDDVLVIPETQYSELDSTFPQITGLRLVQIVVKSEEGTVDNYLEVWFSAPDLTNNPIYTYEKAKVYISDNGGTSYRYVGETSGNYLRITEDINPGTTYRVAVTSVTKRGQEGALDNSPTADITISANLLVEVDIFAYMREYKLTNIDRIQRNLFDPDYTRDVFVLKTADTWQDLEESDWDGLDISNRTVEASGSIEQMDFIDLGILSTYQFNPVISMKNVSGGSVVVQVATSADAITFSSFADINPASDYANTRYIKFKILMSTSDTAKQVYLYGCLVELDSPIIQT